MYKIPLFLFFLIAPFGVFAQNVDVVASIPSGTYHTPVRITLLPTQNGAKTFYSFKPDGYPQDAFLYTGSILLKHSTPFIYFSIISTSNESKIKQNNYIIEYPSAVRFRDETVSDSGKIPVDIVNSGSEPVDIGYWYVQSESSIVNIPEGTMIASWATHRISMDYSGNGSITLRSPDDDERDILAPEKSIEKDRVVSPRKPIVTTKVVPRKIISTAEIPPKNPSSVAGISDTEVKEPVSPEKIQSPSLDIGNVMKASVSESGQKTLNPFYPIAFLLFSFGIGWIQWFVRKKRNQTKK